MSTNKAVLSPESLSSCFEDHLFGVLEGLATAHMKSLCTFLKHILRSRANKR